MGFIGGGVTPGYASCFGPPSANLALARRGLLAVVRLRRTFPACSLVRRLIADLIMFKKKPGDRLSIPPVVSVRRPMPSRTGGYHRSSALGVTPGLPPRATLVRPPATDFPDVIDGWGDALSVGHFPMIWSWVYHVQFVPLPAYVILSPPAIELCERCANHIRAEHEPAEGRRPSVAPCKRRAERSDARRAAWGCESPLTQEPAGWRANENYPPVVLSPARTFVELAHCLLSAGRAWVLLGAA